MVFPIFQNRHFGSGQAGNGKGFLLEFPTYSGAGRSAVRVLIEYKVPGPFSELDNNTCGGLTQRRAVLRFGDGGPGEDRPEP